MSSVPRSSRGIDSNVQFFLAVGAGNGASLTDVQTEIDDAAAAGDLLGNLGSVLNINGAPTIPTSITINDKSLLRDMGKTLYVQNNGVNTQIYKLVQLVDGPNGAVFYALVWDADGNGVTLVRTGY